LEDGFAVGLQTLQGAVPAEADVGNRDQLTRIRRHLAWLLPADRPLLPAWPLDDADWLVAAAHARTCTEALTARQPLPWGGQVVPGTAEMYLVQFAHRTDVLTAGHADAHVLLDAQGKVLRIERSQTLRAA
jgi:hypothetical protein